MYPPVGEETDAATLGAGRASEGGREARRLPLQDLGDRRGLARAEVLGHPFLEEGHGRGVRGDGARVKQRVGALGAGLPDVVLERVERLGRLYRLTQRVAAREGGVERRAKLAGDVGAPLEDVEARPGDGDERAAEGAHDVRVGRPAEQARPRPCAAGARWRESGGRQRAMRTVGRQGTAPPSPRERKR